MFSKIMYTRNKTHILLLGVNEKAWSLIVLPRVNKATKRICMSISMNKKYGCFDILFSALFSI